MKQDVLLQMTDICKEFPGVNTDEMPFRNL